MPAQALAESERVGARVPTLLTVKQFAAKHPAFPEGGLRHRIFHAQENGLAASGAVVRNSGRVLIDEERFFAWVRGTK